MANINGGKRVLLAAAAVLTVAGVVGGMTYFSRQRRLADMKASVEVETIYDGISVDGVPLGGKTLEQAEAVLTEELSAPLADKKIKLVSGDQTWEIAFRDFSAAVDIKKAAKQAYDVARVGTLEERYAQIQKIGEDGGLDLQTVYTFDESKIRELVLAVEEKVKKEPQNAVMKRENGKFAITEEQSGTSLDEEKTMEQVLALARNHKEGEITIAVKETPPAITKEMCEQSTDLIGSFSTTFSSGAVGRNENLRVGCENINGTLLAPGDIFSMNVELGPQTYENGYRNAAVIVDGKIEDGLAGGVCQITTTLYNAVIFAELDVVERANHSLAVAYVPLGRDAAVAGDYKDLKFKNTTDYPVFVEAYLDGNKLICNLYGHEVHDAGRKVEFEQVYIGSIPKPAEKVTLNPDLPEGERDVTYQGKVGSKVSTYKKVYENGELVSREWFSDSTYRATADEVTVGTKKAEAVPVTAPENGGAEAGEQTPELPTEEPETAEEAPIGAE